MSIEVALLTQILNKPSGDTSLIDVEAAVDIPALSSLSIDVDGKAHPRGDSRNTRYDVEGEAWRSLVPTNGADPDRRGDWYEYPPNWHALGNDNFLRFYSVHTTSGPLYIEIINVNPSTGAISILSSSSISLDPVERTALIPAVINTLRLAPGKYVVGIFCAYSSQEYAYLCRIDFDEGTLDLTGMTYVHTAIYANTNTNPVNRGNMLLYPIGTTHWGVVFVYNNVSAYYYTYPVDYNVGTPWADEGNLITGVHNTNALLPYVTTHLPNGVTVFWGRGSGMWQWHHDLVAKTMTRNPNYTYPIASAGGVSPTQGYASYCRLLHDDGAGGLYALCGWKGVMTTAKFTYDPLTPGAFIVPDTPEWSDARTVDGWMFDDGDGFTFHKIGQQKWVYVKPITGEEVLDTSVGAKPVGVFIIELIGNEFVSTRVGTIGAAVVDADIAHYIPLSTADAFYIPKGATIGLIETPTYGSFMVGVTDMVSQGDHIPVVAIATEAILAGNLGKVKAEGSMVYQTGTPGERSYQYVVTSTGHALRKED